MLFRKMMWMSTTFCAQENLSVSMGGTDWLLDLQIEKKLQLWRKHRMKKKQTFKEQKTPWPIQFIQYQ